MELSRLDCTVQPTYLFGDGRRSEQRERQTMAEILEALRQHPQTKAHILPLECVDIRLLSPVPAISEAYHNIIKEFKLGSQYEWIGWYAAQHPGCELCSEKPHPTGNGYMQKLIVATGEVVPTNDIHNFKVVSSREDVSLLLGNVFFPIKDKMEVDMVRLVKEWGYEDVMRRIWFCHNPIKGQPCGMCRPCAEKMESGMAFLLSTAAQRRYRVITKYGSRLPKGDKLISRLYRLLP